MDSTANLTLRSTHEDSIIDTSLHKNILEILFKHREEVFRKLIDLKGIFLLDHIAIEVIDPDNRIVLFSITPSVEYNLFVQGLWKYDKSFSANFQTRNPFYVWERAYSKLYLSDIKKIKELRHGFTFGFNISKKIDAFTLIYSFATRSQNSNLLEYYQSNINELFKLGDYAYKLIHNLYVSYCEPKYLAPLIYTNQNLFKKPFLYLINNRD